MRRGSLTAELPPSVVGRGAVDDNGDPWILQSRPLALAELEEALRRIGVKRGAQVEVGGEDLEWQ